MTITEIGPVTALIAVDLQHATAPSAHSSSLANGHTMGVGRHLARGVQPCP